VAHLTEFSGVRSKLPNTCIILSSGSLVNINRIVLTSCEAGPEICVGTRVSDVREAFEMIWIPS